MAAPKKTVESELSIQPIRLARTTLRIIGTTPLLQNRMAAKSKQQLLIGGTKKTRADKAMNIKHNPLAEYRDAAETVASGPTALGLKVVAVKAAMSTAALETPGLTKASAQRLLFMPGDHAPLWGVPQLRMDVVRSADIAKTPDIRTRPFIPIWGAEIEIQHVIPQLPVQSVVTLLCNAGILVGVGDGRQEKGKFAFGSFRVLGDGEDDPVWDELVANHGREAQLAALESPEYADGDTADLMEHFFAEQRRRAS